MSEFDVGWFNCYCSFISEFIDQRRGCDFAGRILLNVARAAGVTLEEIDSVIETVDDKEVKDVLMRIKDDLSKD